jgi:hypothetical protein
MKRYIKSSGNSSDSRLVSAIIKVIWSCFGMGDSYSDIVEGLADLGNIDLPEDDYDEDKMLKSILNQLVAQRSSAIPEFIIYNFTEYPDMLLEEISTDSPSGKDSKLYKAIKTIYNRIGEFPGGDAVKSAIKENIFNSDLIMGNAAEIGYAIGSVYWKYIKSKEYGVRSNTACAIGVSMGCRDAIGGKYKYAFMQDISSYFYSDLRKQNPQMPSDTGYMLKFYNDRQAVCADVFNLYTVPSSTSGVVTWDIGNNIIHTFTFTEFDDAGIDTAAHEIADWYDSHVQDAIDAALNYVR